MPGGPEQSVPAAPGGRLERPRGVIRVALGVAYLLAGILHIISPAGFLKITPVWVPYPELVVFLTGLAEIAGGFCLMLVQQLRRPAAIGLALYAVCVFPANINHAVNGIAIGGEVLTWWYHGPRLLLQPVLVWLALWTGQVIDWPFRSPRAA